MKTPFPAVRRRGFTLMELMVAMAITLIIVTVLVSITAIATDTWNRSRAELRASRQAKAMVNMMAKDFECIVTRRGNSAEWLSALSSASPVGGGKAESPNSSELMFFSAATDRYSGKINDPASDKGGDVSGVGYKMLFKNPIDSGDTAYRTFVFYRLLVNPDVAFKELLGNSDLAVAFKPHMSSMDQADNFVCENVYQFSVTFHVETNSAAAKKLVTVPVTIGKTTSGLVSNQFRLKGTGIETSAEPSGGVTSDELKTGRVTAIEISITVLSDAGLDQLTKRSFASDEERAKFLLKNSFNYSKRVQVSTL